ncbi:MAG: hypothetical protein ACI8S6_000272 [Myxococcota bacterium]|jgi:hypothetical protein
MQSGTPASVGTRLTHALLALGTCALLVAAWEWSGLG